MSVVDASRTDAPTKPEGKHACSECMKTFSTIRQLKHHRHMEHMVDTVVTCQLCDASFSHEVLLKKHEEYEHGKGAIDINYDYFTLKTPNMQRIILDRKTQYCDMLAIHGLR